MKIAEVLQQLSENNEYVQGLSRKLQNGQLGRDRIVEELNAVAEQNQECLEFLGQMLGIAIQE